MKKTIFLITSLLAMSLLATTAFSAEYYHDGRNNPSQNRIFPNLRHRLDTWQNLSNKQKNKLRTLRQKFIDETYEINAALAVKNQKIRNIMRTSSPDKAKIDKLVRQITKLQGKLLRKRVNYQLAAKKIAPKLNVTYMGDLDSQHGRED
ncbi:MAG: periplasmic heavy metal sensor [Desulfobacteraceae bacterium]|nr:periplasmic heavy metal sensor [Desulfobacteraceae bacterium]